MILHAILFICFYLRWSTLTVSPLLISAIDVICCFTSAVRNMIDFWQFCQRCFSGLFFLPLKLSHGNAVTIYCQTNLEQTGTIQFILT